MQSGKDSHLGILTAGGLAVAVKGCLVALRCGRLELR